MSQPYFVASRDQKRDLCAEEYDLLFGPDGWECLLTEPEDRIWRRDLRQVVDRLNEQHAEIQRLRERLGEKQA